MGRRDEVMAAARVSVRAGTANTPEVDALAAAIPGHYNQDASLEDVALVLDITGREFRTPSTLHGSGWRRVDSAWQRVNVARVRAALRRWAVREELRDRPLPIVDPRTPEDAL